MDIGLGIMLLLVNLVDSSVLRSLGTGAETSFGALGNVLVDLLLSSGISALDSLGDVVGGLLQWQDGQYINIEDSSS